MTASGSTATLTTSLGTLAINKFGSVTANQKNGTSNTVHQDTANAIGPLHTRLIASRMRGWKTFHWPHGG